MDYSLTAVHRKMREELDKIGSDYFPLPILLNKFQKASLDFIGERLKMIEKNQTVTDDIRHLIKNISIPIIVDPNAVRPDQYIAAVPSNYLRLVRCSVGFTGEIQSRRVTMATQGEVDTNYADPYKEPTTDYPMVTQFENYFGIHAKNILGIVPEKFNITYGMLPSIAGVTQGSTRIINLPDDAIEAIISKMVTFAHATTGDERGPQSYSLQETNRKILR